MSRRTFARGMTLAAVGVALVVGTTAPVSAQGFFDQLFGARPDAQPHYDAVPPSPYEPMPSGDIATPLTRHKQVVVDEKPVLQKPTDLMHDKTLQVGDAVMMKDGIHVYNGPEASKHNRKQFVALDDARDVDLTSRVKLAALDTTRTTSVREGRSTTEIVQGFKITDARGNSIRYVGP